MSYLSEFPDFPSSERFGLYRYSVATDDCLYSGDIKEEYVSNNYQDILNKITEWKG